jgi:predicted RND superfamily exporter protein
MSRSERVAAWVWDKRRSLALVCALVTLLAGWQAGKVGVDNSLRIWFLEDDPNLVSYRSYQERFGSDEVVLIAFRHAEGMAGKEGLQLLRRAEKLLAGVDGVTGAISVAGFADAVQLEALLMSPMTGDPLIRAGDEDLRRRILADPELRDRLISRDGTTAALVVRMRPGDEIDARRDDVLRSIEEALEKLGEPHHVAGIGALYVALNRLAVADAFVLFCGSVALLFVLLCLVYRRIMPAAVTLGVALLAMLWTMGLYGAAGRNLNMVTTAMPTVLLVVGTAEMVHILLYAASRQQGGSPREKVVSILGHMLPPCLLNIVTSAVGFAALATSPLPAVRDLGIFTAAGLLACQVLTVLACAFVLGSRRCEPRTRANEWLRQAAVRLCELGIRHPLPTLAMWAAVTLAAAAAASRVEVDTFTLEFLARDHPVRRDSEFIETNLAPYVPMEFLVRSADGAVSPELMGAIERWQSAGERVPGVGWSRSPVNWLRQHEQRFPAGIFFDERLDEYRAGASARLDPRLDRDGTLRVTFSVRMQSAKNVDRTMQTLVEQAHMPYGTTVQPAGYLPLYARMISYVVDSQVSGFAFAFAGVFGVIVIAFRSMKIAILALVSNLLPLVLILGAMGVSGIRLDAATVTIASVVLGLVVDDTVHFVHRLRGDLARHTDRPTALRATVGSTGHAILATALVMTLAFSVFALSEIRSLFYFGLLISLAMAASVLTDLLLIPALVMLRRSTGRNEPC